MIRRISGVLGKSLGLAMVLIAVGPSPVAGQDLGRPGSSRATGVGTEFELTFWQTIAGSDDIAQYQAYLNRYPNGTFAELARLRITALGGTPPTAPAPSGPASVSPPPAPVASPPPLAQSGPVPVPPASAPLAAGAAVAGPPVNLAASVPAPAAPAPAPAAPAPVTAPATTNLVASTQAPGAVSPAAAIPDGPEAGKVYSLLTRFQFYGRQRLAPAPVLPPEPEPLFPDRPQLVDVPQLTFPQSFCSAEERNVFHDTRYLSSKEAADNNNRDAIAHLDTLRALYGRQSDNGDFDALNAIAKEAQAYRLVADGLFEQSASYAGLFEELMNIPIVPCQQGGDDA